MKRIGMNDIPNTATGAGLLYPLTPTKTLLKSGSLRP